MNTMNRMATAGNPYQGDAKRVLCVCSAGLLRSPTAAYVLANEPFDYNTRAAGVVSHFALIPVDDVLIHWADEIVCMETSHHMALVADFADQVRGKNIVVLEIPDNYERMDPELIKLIKTKYREKMEAA